MFCIKCGKEAKMGNFCEACFAGSESLFSIKDMKMIYCDLCGVSQTDIIRNIENGIKTENAIEKTTTSLKIVGNKVHATVTCRGRIKKIPKEETKKILLVLRKKMCDMHVKFSGGYYEAVLQVRGPEKEHIMKLLKRLLPRKSVVSIEPLNEGYDIRIMNKSTAAAAAKLLRNKFSIKDSYKLVGSKKGQKLYRNYYAVR